MCIYDGNDALVAQASAPAGGTCGTTPCWKGLGNPAGSRGYKYKDGDRTPDGLLKVVLKPGSDQEPKIVVKGKGANLPDPTLPLSLPVRAQLQAGNRQCWTSTYDSPGVQRNDASQFRARGGS